MPYKQKKHNKKEFPSTLTLIIYRTKSINPVIYRDFFLLLKHFLSYMMLINAIASKIILVALYSILVALKAFFHSIFLFLVT